MPNPEATVQTINTECALDTQSRALFFSPTHCKSRSLSSILEFGISATPTSRRVCMGLLAEPFSTLDELWYPERPENTHCRGDPGERERERERSYWMQTLVPKDLWFRTNHSSQADEWRHANTRGSLSLRSNWVRESKIRFIKLGAFSNLSSTF